MMKVKRYDSSDLKHVLIGMITDQTVCSRISAQWGEGNLFETQWANLISQWCVSHLRKYGTPPGKKIQSKFENWAEHTRVPEATIDLVAKFLSTLSDEHDQEPQNSDYLLDVAGRYLNKVKLKRLADGILEDLERGRVEEAYDSVVSVSKVELGTGAVIKPAEDFDVWRQAFDFDRQRELVAYPGELGRWVNPVLTRDSLLALMASDKTGKSFWLRDLAYRGLRARRRVAYIEAGDNSQDKVLRLFGQRATGLPADAGTFEIPTGWNADGTPTRESRTLEALTASAAYKRFQKVSRGADRMRISCHPNSTINVMGILSMMRDWEREGWVPDMIVIDYADILANPDGVSETNDRIDETWKQLRRLSQELHCLVVTATQANAAAYQNDETKVLSRRNFSGRKTKLAHVNGMLALNVAPKDKDRGVTRVNWVVRREGAYSETRCVYVAGCLAIGRPTMISRS